MSVRQPLALLLLDFEKAYDSVDWVFLEESLQQDCLSNWTHRLRVGFVCETTFSSSPFSSLRRRMTKWIGFLRRVSSTRLAFQCLGRVGWLLYIDLPRVQSLLLVVLVANLSFLDLFVRAVP